MNWHRYFGLLLTDFFTGSPFVVEMERDLSLTQQYLDVIIVRRRKGRFAARLPDGLDDLAAHNLISFKSHQETLDDWALKELTGHYVNYRKQLSPGDEPLLPENVFRLYAVCSRFPQNLAQTVPWETLRQGVYQCRRGTDVFRVVVAGQLAQHEHNALLHLLSASAAQVGYGTEHYRQRSADTSTLIELFINGYRGEGLPMPYTMEDFRREFRKGFLRDLTPEQRQEALQALTLDQVLEALAPEQRELFRQQLQAQNPADRPKRRRKK